MLADAVALAEAADKVVIFAGLPESMETEGCDRDSMRIPESQNLLISRIAKANRHVTVVLHGGSCMELLWAEEVRSILLMHLGGDRVGEAEMNLLTGKANPSGKLAETWPMCVEDNPAYLLSPFDHRKVPYSEQIFVGYRYYQKRKMAVRFCFGHGMSYSDFAYSDLKISVNAGSADSETFTEKDTLTVTCTVRNTGTVAGKEVVQLYVSRPDSRVRRPVRELKGFRKINLASGEEKKVRFDLDARAFSYYEVKIHDWFADNGRAIIEIGASSEDIRLCGTMQMNSGMTIPVHITQDTTIGELMQTEKGAALIGQMMDMPLSFLMSYGLVTEEQLEAIIERLS